MRSRDVSLTHTVYGPPDHARGTDATKADAEASEEHFDGETTE